MNALKAVVRAASTGEPATLDLKNEVEV